MGIFGRAGKAERRAPRLIILRIDIEYLHVVTQHGECDDTVKMKLDTKVLRHLTNEDWRVLAAVSSSCGLYPYLLSLTRKAGRAGLQEP